MHKTAQTNVTHMPKNWVHEAVFGFREAGLKLDVTMWVPRFVQSVLHVNSCKILSSVPERLSWFLHLSYVDHAFIRHIVRSTCKNQSHFYVLRKAGSLCRHQNVRPLRGKELSNLWCQSLTQCFVTRVTRKQTLRYLSMSYPKKDGRAWPRPSFFWYDIDKYIKACFLVTRVTKHWVRLWHQR